MSFKGGQMAQAQNSNINLIRFLYKRYRQKGKIVYTDILSDSIRIPNTWTGSHPDLLISSGDRHSAVSIETFDTLADEKIADKWKSFIGNNNTKLKIVVREEDELKVAKRLARAYNIDIEFQRVKKTPPEKRKVRVKTRSRRALKLDWVILITSLIILSVSLLLFGPMILKLFKVQDYYQPFDAERQIYKLQKSMKTLEPSRLK